jgi:copper(I)-binding protein
LGFFVSDADPDCRGRLGRARLGRASTRDEIKAGDLVISQAWSRATPKGAKIGGGT